MVKPFDQWDGVHRVISGYTGGHYEAVQITYDPHIISYEMIVNLFWKQMDITDDGGQFHDRGDSYRTAIFYHHMDQKKIADQTKQKLAESGIFDKPIVTNILPAQPFYPAEDYHQDFDKRYPKEYIADRTKSGRDEFISAALLIEVGTKVF